MKKTTLILVILAIGLSSCNFTPNKTIVLENGNIQPDTDWTIIDHRVDYIQYNKKSKSLQYNRTSVEPEAMFSYSYLMEKSYNGNKYYKFYLRKDFDWHGGYTGPEGDYIGYDLQENHDQEVPIVDWYVDTTTEGREYFHYDTSYHDVSAYPYKVTIQGHSSTYVFYIGRP